MQRERSPRDLVVAALAALILLTAAACSTGSDATDPAGPDPAADDASEPDADGDTSEPAEDPAEDDDVPRWGDDDEMACIEEHPTDVDLDDPEMLNDPSPGTLLPVIEVLLECIEEPSESPGVRSLVGAAFGADGRARSLNPEEGECFVREVAANADDPALALAGGGGESDNAVIGDAAADCLSDQTRDAMFGATGEGPQDYGDDPQLDSMWDDCADGNMRACDLLYFQVSTGSAYEAHAETCGGADPDPSTFCSPDTDVDGNWMLQPDSTAALNLVADCDSGDFTACDLLYQISPVGSDLENWGVTCGERVPEAALPDCRTLLG